MSADFVLVHGARAILALVFLVAALQKLRDLDAFGAALGGYALLPAATVGAAARVLAVLELVAGVALIARPGSGAWLAGALLVLVTGAVIVNLLRGHRDVGCGCGGIEDEQPLSWALVARNAVLLAGVALAALQPHTRELSWLDYVSVAGVALCGYGLYVGVSQLIANAPRLARLRTTA